MANFWRVLEPIELVLMGHALSRVGHIWVVTQAVPMDTDFGFGLVDGARLPCNNHAGQSTFCIFRAAGVEKHPIIGWAAQDTGTVYSTTDSHPALAALLDGALPEYGWLDSKAVELHNRVAANALAWRWGLFPTEQCALCCHACVHQTEIDLGWILRGLLPWSIHIVNVGCQALSTNDPTHVLIRDHQGEVTGVCLDIVTEELMKAERWLRSLGQKTSKFHTVTDHVTPENASHWLLSSKGGDEDATAAAPTTVLKVDIDTLEDEAIVAETLRIMTLVGQQLPLTVVVEYDSRIPPPFRFRCLRTIGISFPPFYGCQPSLSYWVELLAGYSYFLYKASDRDLVFLQEPLAHAAAHRDGISLPIDEFACYLLRSMHRQKTEVDEALYLLQHNMTTKDQIGTALDHALNVFAPIVPYMKTAVSTRYSLPFEISHPASDLQEMDGTSVGQQPLRRLRREATPRDQKRS